MKVVGKDKMRLVGNNIMLDQGLAYFVPYNSFTCPKLLITIAMRHNPQGYIIKEYKEKKEGEEESEYQPYTFLDYSLATIVNAFAVIDD